MPDYLVYIDTEMSVLAFTAITNFLLAGEVLFLAGMAVRAPKAAFSAAWFWSAMLLLLGAAALVGGIDHGFVEPAQLPRYAVQRLTWLLLAGMTFSLLMTAARQFFAGRFQRLLLTVALIHLTVAVAAILLIDSFLVIVLDYAPVLLLFLILDLRQFRTGGGSLNLAVGLIILAAASAIQALGFDALSPLDHNGVYHLISMIGVVFLYRGAGWLRASTPPPASG